MLKKDVSMDTKEAWYELRSPFYAQFDVSKGLFTFVERKLPIVKRHLLWNSVEG